MSPLPTRPNSHFTAQRALRLSVPIATWEHNRDMTAPSELGSEPKIIPPANVSQSHPRLHSTALVLLCCHPQPDVTIRKNVRNPGLQQERSHEHGHAFVYCCQCLFWWPWCLPRNTAIKRFNNTNPASGMVEKPKSTCVRHRDPDADWILIRL